METKVCTKCKEEKLITEIVKNSKTKSGYGSVCKVCIKRVYKEYRENNPDRFNKVRNDWIEKNKDEIKRKSKVFYQNDIENQRLIRRLYYANNKEKFNEAAKCYRQKNKGKIVRNKNRNKEERNRKERLRKKTDLFYSIKCKVQGVTSKAFIRKGYSKGGKTEKILGCQFDFIKGYIEKKFKKGMTWENHGEWHIDHKIPIASAKTEEELIILCHYTNLQPLWAKDNLFKGDRIVPTQMTMTI